MGTTVITSSSLSKDQAQTGRKKITSLLMSLPYVSTVDRYQQCSDCRWGFGKQVYRPELGMVERWEYWTSLLEVFTASGPRLPPLYASNASSSSRQLRGLKYNFSLL